MFDERFARQYRYELPSEFPLTSPYTGIVHHLSGPKNNALTQTSSKRKKSVDAAGFLASFTFISRVGFSTTTLALVLDSLVRVSRRVGKNHFDKIAQGPSSRPTPNQRALLRRVSRTASGIRRLHLVSAGARVARVRASQSGSLEYISTGSASTISSLLTLFPKCFSSFLHSTCSLSVSYLYLALEEVYLPLSALVSKYTTLRRPACVGPGTIRGSHPLRRHAQVCTSAPSPGRPAIFRSQFAEPKPGDYQCGLFPLPSPVLRESLLVSFPPLNDMLKFGGWSYFISDAM